MAMLASSTRTAMLSRRFCVLPCLLRRTALVASRHVCAAPHAGPSQPLPQAACIAARCMTTAPPRLLCSESCGADAGAAASCPAPIGLVNEGIGWRYHPIPIADDALQRMDAATLVRMLAADGRFKHWHPGRDDLTLDGCTVWLLPSVAGERPTAEEEDACVELEGAGTIGELLAAIKWKPSKLLYLRVHLPHAGPSPGSVSFDESLRIPRHVWRTLPAAVQDRTLRNHALRCELATIPALMQLQDLMGDDSWPAGVVNLMPDVAPGPLQLGMIRIPAIAETFIDSPKGYEEALTAPSDLLLDATRVKLASDFVKHMKRRHWFYGVLLSGPKGVGKSAVGLLTFLACYAQRLPVAYIADASSWIAARLAQRENGPVYILHTFIGQNTGELACRHELQGPICVHSEYFADIILSNARLRQLLLPVLRGEEHATPRTLYALGEASLHTDAPTVGIIADEIQQVTRAMETVSEGDALDFRWVWFKWNEPFARMTIGACHGSPKFKLSSGDEVRLRFIQPWPQHVRDAFVSSVKSPGFLVDEAVRTRAAFICGGVVRLLVRFKALLHKQGEAADAESLRVVQEVIRGEMSGVCQRWLTSLADRQREIAVSVLPQLIRGAASFLGLECMYDDGIVEKDDRHKVRPVSDMAASVLHSCMARVARRYFRPLTVPSSHVAPAIWPCASDNHRDRELVKQLHAILDCCPPTRVPVRGLDGREAAPTMITTESCQVMRSIGTHLRDHASRAAVLYIPDTFDFAVDAIVVPKAAPGSADPVVILEWRAVHPRSQRITRLTTWFQPDGAVTSLAAAFPGLDIDIVLCDDGDLSYDASEVNKLEPFVAEHNAAAAAASSMDASGERLKPTRTGRVRIVIADREGLSALGVVF